MCFGSVKAWIDLAGGGLELKGQHFRFKDSLGHGRKEELQKLLGIGDVLEVFRNP